WLRSQSTPRAPPLRRLRSRAGGSSVVTPAGQLRAAGGRGRFERGVATLLVALATKPPVGVGVGEGPHAVVPPALPGLARLLHGGGIAGALVLAGRRLAPALPYSRGERRVVLLLVALAAELTVGVGVGKVGHAAVPHALRELAGCFGVRRVVVVRPAA